MQGAGVPVTILRPMSTRLRPLLILCCLALALALTTPAWAQPASPPETGASEPAETEPAESEPAEELPDDGADDDGKIRLPLDLEDKQDLLGLLLIGIIALGGAVALMGAVKQLRGDRPQADGTWRPR